MSCLAEVFKQGPAYVSYLTAGDGGLAQTMQAMTVMAAAGVDIIEVGVPFSEPVADGPVIQAAASRAIAAGVRLVDVIAMIKEFRQNVSTPIVLFSYYNPVLQYGVEKLLHDAKAAGIDGVLIVDLPIEEMVQFHQQCVSYDIDPVLLISPSTTVSRLQSIAKLARGMVYYVCQKGTTGARDAVPADLAERVAVIKQNIQLPVIVGFGIANKTMAAAVLQVADGFVVGSKLVEAIANKPSPNELSAIVKAIDPRLPKGGAS